MQKMIYKKSNSPKVEKLLRILREKQERKLEVKRERERKKAEKTCSHCGDTFNPPSKRSRFCSETCKRKGYYLEARNRQGKPNYNAQAALIDQEEERKAISRKKALEASPDITKLRPVQIDRRTVIFISPGQDPVKAKTNFQLKYQSNNYGINNTTDRRGRTIN